MKKIKYELAIGMAIGMLFFTSCTKERSNETENITDIITSTEITTHNITPQDTTTEEIPPEETTLWGEVAISKDPKVAEAMREVLKGERDFISVDEGNEWTNIHTFDCFDGKSGQKLQSQMFMFEAADIDEDGNYEVMLYLFKENGNQHTGYAIELLRYYEGNVYGYNIHSFKHISGNGGYMWWRGPYYGPNEDYRDYYGIGQYRFVKDKLICTYVFECADTQNERWLRESGILNENEEIICNQEKYEKMRLEKDNTVSYNWHGLHPDNIDTYIK